MKLQKIVAAAALLAAGAANASLTAMDGVSVNGDSSVLLVMLDSTGAQTRGLTIDLGFSYSQFNAASALSGPNVLVQWDFANNTITQTARDTNVATLLSGASTNAWSDQVADFMANADATEVRYALVAGSRRGNTPNQFLATGTPTTAQLSAQNSSATGAFVGVDPLFTTNNTKGTHATAANGAYSMGATDTAYVGTNYAANTSIGGWKNNLKWNGWTALGGSTNVRQLNASGQEFIVGNTASFAGGLAEYDVTGLLNDIGTLSVAANGLGASWTTAVTAVPEPSSYAMALVGMLAVGAMVRRRAA